MRTLLFFILLQLPILLLGNILPKEIFNIEEVKNLSNIPNKEVRRLFQDSDGFIWIATTGGLYRFDGYILKEYRSNIYNNTSLLTSNDITCISEDDDKHLYIGTTNGLNILNKKTEEIYKEKKFFINNPIRDIITTPQKEIWIAADKGLYKYNKEDKSFTNILNKSVKDLFIDSKNNIWIGTWRSGLYRYNNNNKGFIKYPKFDKLNSVHIIYEDKHGKIWLGSFGDGITMLENPYEMEKLSYKTFHAEDKTNNITDNYIYAIVEDKNINTIFFGTRKGISYTNNSDANNIIWNNLYPTFKDYSLPFNAVNALICDNQDNIWLGTLGGGVYKMKAYNYGFNTNNMIETLNKLHSNSITTILVDNKNIWTGIGANGFSINTIEQDYYSPITKTINNNVKVFSLCKAEENKILLGTQNGLYLYDESNTIDNQPFKYKSKNYMSIIHQIIPSEQNGFWIAANNIIGHININTKKDKIIFKEKNEFNTILQTSNNTIWIGTSSNGIIRINFNEKNFNITDINRYNIENKKSPVMDIIHLFKDKENRIWAGTDGGGLCIYNNEKDIFESINNITDFPTDIINSITEDNDGTLWLGSNIGIIRFYPATNLRNSIFRLYDKNNGLPDNQFLPRSVFNSEDGKIYFGTHHGYIFFNPQEINWINQKNNVFITDFKINSNSIISPIIPGYAKNINIPGNYSNFTIEFSPMLYTAPDKVRYAYKLEGYDKEWQYTGSDKRLAQYANLSPGKYHFKLKCTNEFGQWNNLTRELSVNILPPIYMTWWAYCIYAILSVIIIIYIYRSARQKIRLRTAMQIQRIEQEKTNEVNQAKLRFFTNITHELFTPITIISAAIEDSRNLIPQKDYEIISQNTNRLIRLIQQILEFRKAETGNLKLQVTKQNLSTFIAKNIESFLPLMKQKNISIDFKSEEDEFPAYFDSDKIDKILYNLLSNALKYNTEGAHVDVILTSAENGNRAIIQVKDNGKGLTEKTMKNLFKRFYDGDFRKFNTSGTGIGLSLVRDLVVLHKGDISVDNHPGEGVNFIINIPVSSDAFTIEECAENRQQNELMDNDSPEIIENTGNNEFNVLIVEDNPDLILLMKNILSRKYNVFTSGNGKEAMDVLKEQDIQLIISDVMMPEMNGYELCQRIKNDIEYSHIPIILLTAKTGEEDVVDAYKSGADAYLKKPFSVNVLQARISNLLQAREKRIKEFKGQMVFKPQEIDYTTPDEEFIKQVMDCVYKNYADPEFDQNKLTDILGYSKSTLYRKLKSLTGMTTSNLIKDVRLKMAYELLNKKGGTRISEIAYLVGFNDPKYFAICFKKEFGKLPSEIENYKH